jgi:hypothetical protein
MDDSFRKVKRAFWLDWPVVSKNGPSLNPPENLIVKAACPFAPEPAARPCQHRQNDRATLKIHI